MSSSNSHKRDRLVFRAVQELDEQDAVALTNRKASTKRQKQASSAAISQQRIYMKLLEVRILLQRVLQAVDAADGMNEEDENQKEALQQCNSLLANLLHARDTLLTSGNDDKVKSLKGYDDLLNDDEALEEKLSKDYQKCEKEWEKVMNQRHKDVRLHAGLTSKSQFRILDSSFWEQVQQTVMHEELMKKKRESGEPEGGKPQPFDDSKVYQQVIKDFLTSSSSTTAGNNKGDHQQKQQQASSVERLRGNTRRTVNHVDRRSSKGRKLRYTPVPKLVNFTFPLSRPAPTRMLDEDAWFKSLFGGVAAAKNS